MSRAANARLVQGCLDAIRAIGALSDRGCRVVDVRLGGRSPVIYIEAGAAAEQLGGAMYMRERIGRRLVATYVARVAGCQVRWPADVVTPPPSNVVRFQGAGRAA